MVGDAVVVVVTVGCALYVAWAMAFVAMGVPRRASVVPKPTNPLTFGENYRAILTLSAC